MPKSVPNSQLKAIAIAMAGATVTAAGTMFVPVGILENITGSTGLSELIPAARAPLGDTARALIAFGAGAFTLAGLTFLLFRKDVKASPRLTNSVPASEWAEEPDDTTLTTRLARIKLPTLSFPKMPWAQDDDAITDLAHLPKLRNGDMHPDAPPRRPLFANLDLPAHGFDQVTSSVIVEPVTDMPLDSEEITAVSESFEDAPAEPVAVAVEAANVEPTLAEMVAQLEAAVAERQKQLAELEIVATQLMAAQGTPSAPEEDEAEVADEVETVAIADITVEPPRESRPPLEVVTGSAQDIVSMDSTLAAALATLHRMNGTGR